MQSAYKLLFKYLQESKKISDKQIGFTDGLPTPPLKFYIFIWNGNERLGDGISPCFFALCRDRVGLRLGSGISECKGQ